MKYIRLRDTRKMVDGVVVVGTRLSCCITAASAEEADEIFEGRWAYKVGNDRINQRHLSEAQGQGVRPQPWMTAEALELKRRTPVFATGMKGTQ